MKTLDHPNISECKVDFSTPPPFMPFFDTGYAACARRIVLVLLVFAIMKR